MGNTKDMAYLSKRENWNGENMEGELYEGVVRKAYAKVVRVLTR